MVSKVALLLSLGVAQGGRIKRRDQIAGVKVRNFVEDAEDWIMTFAPGTTDADISAFCKDSCQLVGHPDKGGSAWAAVKGKAKVEQMLHSEQMSHSSSGSRVEFLEPDKMTYAIPLIESDVGKAASASWGLDEVGVPGRAFHGKGVHIYMMDTGIRTTHSDFGGRAIPGLDVSDGKPKECNGNAECAKDTLGHGTHCAGTAASATYGVADQATIHAIKTLGPNGGANSWQFSGVDWVVSSGLRPAVISASLGSSGIDLSWQGVIQSAINAGVVVVVAAGNSVDSACLYSPAWLPEAITVGATSAASERAWYSNFGPCVDIMAPGTDIVSTWVSSDTSDREFSGTSMACPHVSGASALILEEDPAATPAKVRKELQNRGGFGLVDDLRNSADIMLWVGASAAPTGAPTPAPPPTCDSDSSTGPDSDADCKCKSGYECSEGGSSKCTYSRTVKDNSKSVRYHLVGCAGCECKSTR